MSDPNAAIRGPAPASLPKWLAKTHARYDADDVAFTPPSEDGSHFFSLHLALSNDEAKPTRHKSTYDKINEELGYAESAAGRRLSVGKVNSPRRSSGLCLSTELQSHSQDQRIETTTADDQQRYAVKPLLVIPRVFSSDPATRSPERKDSSLQSKIFESVAKESHIDSEQAPSDSFAEKSIQRSSAQMPSLERADRTMHFGKDVRELKHEFKAEDSKYNIVDSVRNLFYGKSSAESQNMLEVSSPTSRKISCPQFGQGAPPEFQREETQYISCEGVVLERSVRSCNTFFYRPAEVVIAKAGSDNHLNAPENAPPTPQSTLSDAERQMAAENAATATVSTRVRRPKPSRLREMNFWAPTSM